MANVAAATVWKDLKIQRAVELRTRWTDLHHHSILEEEKRRRRRGGVILRTR